MRILIVHVKYQQPGGEDTVVQQELELLQRSYQIESLFFQNKGGVQGAIQFLLSIWNVFAARKIEQKIKNFQPDVIHVHNWHFAFGPIVFRVAKKMGVPVVHTVHNYRLLCPSAILLHDNKLFTDSLHQNFPWKALKNKVYRNSWIQTFWLAFIVWFHKKIGTWRMVNTYICLTDFAVDLFQKSNFGIDRLKFVVKPNFTVAQDSYLAMHREGSFLFVGRLSEEKGVRTLVEAGMNSGLTLRIAGNGPLKELVKNASKEAENITYLGTLEKDHIRLEMSQAQALIFPSIWFEGMPMTILEALSCGTPVIASRIGAPESLILENETGLFFEPGNSEKLVKVMHQYNTFSKAKKEEFQKNALDSYNSKYADKNQQAYFATIYSAALND
jgi:glycosyltransferase involved in cell wall biosynthesis